MLQVTIVKPKQASTCGRGIRNECMSNTNTILILNAMDQIQFINFQDYVQYYTVNHKENRARVWKFGIVDDG